MNNSLSEETVREGAAWYYDRNLWPGRRDTKEEVIRYALAVDATPYQDIREWLTVRCTECNMLGGQMTEEEASRHLFLVGYVIIGCEGYYLVNPEPLGLSFRDGWEDWTPYYGDFDARLRWQETGVPAGTTKEEA